MDDRAEIPTTKFTIETTDTHDMELYAHALGYSCALFAIEGKLREILKYREGLTGDAYAIVEEIRDFFYEQKNSNHLPE